MRDDSWRIESYSWSAHRGSERLQPCCTFTRYRISPERVTSSIILGSPLKTKSSNSIARVYRGRPRPLVRGSRNWPGQRIHLRFSRDKRLLRALAPKRSGASLLAGRSCCLTAMRARVAAAWRIADNPIWPRRGWIIGQRTFGARQMRWAFPSSTPRACPSQKLQLRSVPLPNTEAAV
jgi:hypothetical protein